MSEDDCKDSPCGAVMHTHIREPMREIQEQFGYNAKKLNRLKMRREHELTEFNFGINFSKLK